MLDSHVLFKVNHDECTPDKKTSCPFIIYLLEVFSVELVLFIHLIVEE